MIRGRPPMNEYRPREPRLSSDSYRNEFTSPPYSASYAATGATSVADRLAHAIRSRGHPQRRELPHQLGEHFDRQRLLPVRQRSGGSG